ncbi:MAG: FAD:protein FMN transferase [Pedobacter sp.]|nr:FAD:protein FMN transferase [Pedobacter sp.]
MPERRVLIPLDLDDTPPPAGAELYHLQGDTMGTTWSVRMAGPRGLMPDMLRMGVERQLASVIAEMSTWEKDSAISRFNQAAAGSWHELPADFFTVLDYSLALAAQSEGAFDPTVGPLVNLWGFGPDGRRDVVPEAAALAEVSARCGWQRLQLDEENLRALQPGGAYVDFSGVAKGFAVDKVSAYLQDQGFPNHLVEIGGELRGSGIRPDGHPWWVMLEPVKENAEGVETVVALHNLSVATSGDYRRFFMQGEQRFAHTLDPRSGHPVTHPLASVTVLHESCMQADAEATVLMVLGVQEGMAWAERHELAALFVERREGGFVETMTPAFAALLE